MKSSMKLFAVMFVICALLSGQIAVFAQMPPDITAPKYPDVSRGRGSSSKGASDAAKLTPELRMLYAQYRSGGKSGGNSPAKNEFSLEQLREIFGITSSETSNPTVGIAVTTDASADVDALRKSGMKVYMRQGNTVYGQAPVLSLGRIAGEKSVNRIAATKSAKTPELPKQLQPPTVLNTNSKGATPTSNAPGKSAPLANEFNKANLTGKGVVVGIIDTGIDWRHKDFIRADGTSRILAIWDMFDNSFQDSNGKIGTAPPKLDPNGDPLFGTVYTNAQINAALKGSGTVNTADNQGHGTATAGTAAGNGGSVGGKFQGVAPDADLIIVKAADCGGFVNEYIYGAAWIVQSAKQMKRPVVVNQSFGGHYTAHDGTEQEEQFLNSITGKGIPGVIFTVSAGNEGRYNLRGSGQFGPRRKGQADITSNPLTVNIPVERTGGSGSILLGVFDARDEWGAIVQPVGATTLVDKNNKPVWFYIFKTNGEIKYLLGDGLSKPDWFDGYMQEIIFNSSLGDKRDVLSLAVPAGSYRLWGFGASEKVASGSFDFYAPQYYAVDFGMGTAKSGMVGSPGNAANVITVGAYNFRNVWTNKEGGETMFNLTVGDISDYSSPGGQRRSDGVVKPDISAPATYTISPLSQTAAPGSGSCQGESMGAGLGEKFVTSDGMHIAWSGTSASSPFTAGVIALMLQKNPTLDAEQVRQILIKSAKKGGIIGAVPNPAWGYGMLDPVGALRLTPLPKKGGK